MARTGGQDRPRGQNRAGYVKLAATTSSGGFPGTSGKEPTGQCKRHEMQVLSLCQESPLEKGMATYSSILAWSRGSPGERHGNLLQYSCLVRRVPWRRAWQPTPVFLPGDSHGQRSLAGYSPGGHEESDTTEATKHTSTTSGKCSGCRGQQSHSPTALYQLQIGT